MKRVLSTMDIVAPAFVLLTGVGELCYFYVLLGFKTPFGMNLSSFFVDLLYGVGVGLLWLWVENQKSGGWSIDWPKLLLLLLPMLVVSVYFLSRRYQTIRIDSLINYMNVLEFSERVPFAAHLPYFCSGLFLATAFQKGEVTKPIGRLLRYLGSAVVLIAMILLLDTAVVKFLSISIDFNYFAYEGIVLPTNVLLGVVLSIAVAFPGGPVIDPTKRGKVNFIAAAVCLLVGCVPFLFGHVSLDVFYKSGKSDTFYHMWDFYRGSEFFQVFQILCGLFAVVGIKGWIKRKEAAQIPQ